MNKYRYFNPKGDPKMVGVDHQVMKKLDAFRHLIGTPVRITEGKTKLRGKHIKDSAHLTGFAIDGTIRKKGDSRPYTEKEKIRVGFFLGLVRFPRVGVYSRHFHGDIDMSKPNPVCWTGKSK